MVSLLSIEKVYIIVIASALGLVLGAVVLMVRPDLRKKLEGSAFVPAILGLVGLLLGFIGLKMRDARKEDAQEPHSEPEHPEPKNTTHTPHKGADDGDNITEIETKARVNTEIAIDEHDGDDLGEWLDNHFTSTVNPKTPES